MSVAKSLHIAFNPVRDGMSVAEWPTTIRLIPSGMECCDATKKFVDQNKFAVPKYISSLRDFHCSVIVPTNILSEGTGTLPLKILCD